MVSVREIETGEMDSVTGEFAKAEDSLEQALALLKMKSFPQL
jgi:hypothetical protein